LYHDIPEEIIAVEFVNTNKKILNFIIDRTKNGFFSYSNLQIDPKIGDRYYVRFNGKGQDNFYKVFTARKASDDVECPSIKNYHGTLRMQPNANIGFVGDVFIDPALIQKHSLTGSIELKGKAILSFNKKKQDWGWKAFSIDL
jgi:hypothetical protein